MKENTINEELLLNYVLGRLSLEERQQVEAWYEASAENQRLLDNFYDVYTLERAIVSRDSVDVDCAFRKCLERIQENQRRKTFQIRRKNTWKIVRRVVASAAAIVAIVLCGNWGVDFVEKLQQPFIVRTAVGEKVQVELPDGSHVWLNSCSEIAYSRRIFDRERNVAIKGEGYFEVAKMEGVPFVVNCDQLNIKVLGTKFNVKANENDDLLVTTLMEGSIRVSSPLMKSQLKMKPNEQLVMNKRTREISLYLADKSREANSWMNGRFFFFKARFEEIANSLERNFNIKIEFEDDAIRNKRFIGDFRATDDIHRILTVLQLTEKFDFEISGRNVKIKSRE